MDTLALAGVVIGSAALVLGVIAFAFTRQKYDFYDNVKALLLRASRRITRTKPSKIGTVKVYLPPETFPGDALKPYAIGELKFPLVVLVGGDGTSRYTYPDGIECSWSKHNHTTPRDVQEAYPRFLAKRRRIAEQNRAVLENREHVKIDDYSFGLRRPDDAPWPIHLELSTTDYFTTLATNYSIEEVLPGGMTLREKYGGDPRDLKNSILSNPLAVNLSVVTADKKILLAIRGRKVAVNPARGPGYTPAVSGTANPSDGDEMGNYSVFVTAAREAGEEIRGVTPSFNEITLFGLGRTLRWQFPFLFGELRLAELTAAQVKGLLPRDHWETAGLIALPFSPEAVVAFVRQVYREMDREKITHSTIYAGLFSLLQSVRYEYPDEWTDLVRELSTVEAPH